MRVHSKQPRYDLGLGCISNRFAYDQAAMISLRKVEDIAYLAFQNALRLHDDAIVLFENGRYPSAFLLSVLAQEEIGKMHTANDFVFHNRGIERDEKIEMEWLELLYKHPYKQHSFMRNSLLSPMNAKGYALMQEVFEGALEAKKQMAAYVGLKRSRGKIDIKGKIKHPFQISKKVAHKQITSINDYLLIIGLATRTGGWMQDIDEIERQIKRKDFVLSVSKQWKYKAPATVRLIRKWRKQLGIRIIPV